MGTRRVGLVYDERMCRHANPWDPSHPERPERISSIADRLKSAGIFDRCILVEAREATDDELATVHTKKHIAMMQKISSETYGDEQRRKLSRHYNSVYFNGRSSEAALLAAGSVVEICSAVANGDIDAGAAVIRPPGHHAEADKAMGFCLFNNVAVAAQVLVHEKQDLGIKKILIVDWDVHHGNGTQNMFWNDHQVLYFSVHRYDNGSFYPVGTDGNLDKLGGESALGFNINVPWPHGGFGDLDYLAIWDYLLLPIAKEFRPDMVVISGGFDSAEGDPLGGCCLTPYGYGEMTRKLMDIAEGRVVLVLEGGYNLHSISESYLSCLEVLLGLSSSYEKVFAPKEKTLRSTWHVLKKVRSMLQDLWPVLQEQSASFQEELEAGLLASVEETELESANSSDVESESDILILGNGHFDNKEATHAATEVFLESVTASSPRIFQGDESQSGENDDHHNYKSIDGPMSSLNVGGADMIARQNDAYSNDVALEGSIQTEESRRILHSTAEISLMVEVSSVSINANQSEPYVWYGCYGSNMWKDRFLCYLQGGQVEGMRKKCRGSRCKDPPSATSWAMVKNEMFFGRSYSSTWGNGGVAFLESHPTEGVSTHIRLYKIRLDQFNDLFMMENNISDHGNELIDKYLIDNLNHSSVTVLKDCWYGTVLHLGNKDGLPIMTMTCSHADLQKFQSRLIPLCSPSQAYKLAIAKGLIEDLGLQEEEALSYLSTKIRC